MGAGRVDGNAYGDDHPPGRLPARRTHRHSAKAREHGLWPGFSGDVGERSVFDRREPKRLSKERSA